MLPVLAAHRSVVRRFTLGRLGHDHARRDEGGPDKGNLISALSEGVFLMGAERNADVVRMVSYAPLLAHVEGRSGWHGMIYFDSQRAYGTVSYYL